MIHKYLLYSAPNIISEDQTGRTDVGLPATVHIEMATLGRVTNLLELGEGILKSANPTSEQIFLGRRPCQSQWEWLPRSWPGICCCLCSELNVLSVLGDSQMVAILHARNNLPRWTRKIKTIQSCGIFSRAAELSYFFTLFFFIFSSHILCEFI